jgi:hypothetical protein
MLKLIDKSSQILLLMILETANRDEEVVGRCLRGRSCDKTVTLVVLQHVQVVRVAAFQIQFVSVLVTCRETALVVCGEMLGCNLDLALSSEV